MAATVCDLVLEVCELLDRRDGPGGAELLAADAEVLRAELCAALSSCEDPAVAADGHAAVAQLDALLVDLDTPTQPLLALSA